VEVRATASPKGPGEIGADLDRIEAAVAAGNTDLKALGFWAVVKRVKLDRLLVDEHADQIGRIDTVAFQAGVRLRLPVWLGNTLLVAGTVVGTFAVGPPSSGRPCLWKGLA
jgi:hypothetical protein